MDEIQKDEMVLRMMRMQVKRREMDEGLRYIICEKDSLYYKSLVGRRYRNVDINEDYYNYR